MNQTQSRIKRIIGETTLPTREFHFTSQQFDYFGHILHAMSKGEPFNVINMYLSGSRKSGKTRAIANFCVATNSLPFKTKVIAIMKKSSDMEEGVYGEIQDSIELMGQKIISSNKTPKLKIQLKNTDIIFHHLYSGTESKANLKGLRGNSKYDFVIVWVEEADQIKEQDWASLTEAIRGTDNTLFITSSNPFSKDHWLFRTMNQYYPYSLQYMKKHLDAKKFIADKGIFIHYSCLYGNNLLSLKAKNLMEENVRFRPAGLRDTVLWGAPGQEAGLIYAGSLMLVEEPTLKASYLCGGVDFGYTRDATAGIIYGVDVYKKRRMVVREFYHDNRADAYKGTERQQFDLVKFFVEQYRELRNNGFLTTVQPMYVGCDSADLTMTNNLNIELQSKAHYDDVKHLISFYPTPKMKVKILDRIDKVLYEMNQQILQIDREKCPNLVRELDNCKWSDKEGQIEAKRLDGNDHVINALEMGMIRDNWNIGIII